MSSQRESPNPLRPYYVPPSVGASPELPHHGAAASTSSHNVSTSSQSLGSSARNILSDIDYSEYLSDTSSSSTEAVRRLAEQAVWKYTSILFAQPFEVAKTVLQVHTASKPQRPISRGPNAPDETRRRPSSYSQDSYEVSVLMNTEARSHV